MEDQSNNSSGSSRRWTCEACGCNTNADTDRTCTICGTSNGKNKAKTTRDSYPVMFFVYNSTTVWNFGYLRSVFPRQICQAFDGSPEAWE